MSFLAHLLENSRHRVGVGAPRDGTNKEMRPGERPLPGGTAVGPPLVPVTAFPRVPLGLNAGVCAYGDRLSQLGGTLRCSPCSLHQDQTLNPKLKVTKIWFSVTRSCSGSLGTSSFQTPLVFPRQAPALLSPSLDPRTEHFATS